MIKRRYWLSAAIFCGLGAFFYFLVYGYQFTGILLFGFGVLRLVFGALNLCKRKIFSTILNVGVCVGVLAMIVTGIWIVTEQDGAQKPQARYAVVLGAGVNGDKPSQSLLERVDAAERYAKANPDAILILSGGKGEREKLSEAQCMYELLIERGISAHRLVKEEKASTTQENLQFSLELIERNSGEVPDEIAVISSEYHLLRASLIADELGVQVLGVPAQTENRFYFCNMFLREIFAVWKEVLKSA